MELVIESEAIQPAGYREKVNMKTFLGDIYSAAVNNNHYTFPASEYFKADQRMTVKNAGRYECAPDARTGAHGDTFVSGGLAEWGLRSGSVEAAPVAVRPHGRTAWTGGRQTSGRFTGGMI